MSLENVLLHKSHKLLLALEDDLCVADLSRRCGMTYSYIIKVLEDMKDQNIITMKRCGRAKIITMTPKGREVQMNLFKLKGALQSGDITNNKRREFKTEV